MIRLGLIGHPLGHSLSPKIHAAALKACNLDGSYSLFPIAPDDMQSLKDLIGRVRFGEITGLNVTIPHKQNVIKFLDELTAPTKTIGAVNTTYLRHKKVIGDNTDAPGFLTDLKRNFSSFSFHPSALILGAGGSARAVLYALVNDGWDVTIAARRIEQAQHLADSFTNYKLSRSIPTGLITNLTDFRPSTFDLLVNTTPIGMTPNTGQSPLPENTILSEHTIIYDLVYNPRETKLVKDAWARGSSAITGLGMLIEQATLSFAIWTGRDPSRETMRAAIEQSLVPDL